VSTPTLATGLIRRGVRFRTVQQVQSNSSASSARGRSRRKARAALGWCVAGVVLIHATMVLAMDVAWPPLRDPEYGRRTSALQKRTNKYPDRPLVLFFGSSRTAMGIKPDAWEAVRPGTPGDPLLFNMAIVGSGPITELLTVRRVYDDGFRPAVVLLEYWPPFLRQDGRFAEQTHTDPVRLQWRDQPVIRNYFHSPDETNRRMWVSRLNVLKENRNRLLVQMNPEFFPRAGRIGKEWAELDSWGWLPGMDPTLDDSATRRRLREHQRPTYRDFFDGHTIHPDSDRALREIIAFVRQQGAEVGFLYLPESAEFQSWYPAEVERTSREYLFALSRELNVPVIDTRNWMGEQYLADGFHLSRIGAGVFTAKLGPAIATAFALNPGGKP